MTTTFPRSSPSALGIDARGVAAFVRALESTPGVEPHGLVLLRHGRVAAEGWWAPYSAERAHLLYSLSKSFTAAAVGLAVGEGMVDLDAPVLQYFPELDAEITDERSRRILVRHLLAMASGHREDTVARAEALDPTNTVRGFLLLPPDDEPGSVFAYNQPCTYTLGAIVRRVSGASLVDYLRPRLFEPLGIGGIGWARDDTGAEFGYTGMYATTESIAKLGQLYLQRGVWDGRRILSEDWVRQATAVQVANPAEQNPDWSQGYGFQFWMARHGFRGDGAYGQFCVVLPEHDVVVAMTGQSLDMQAVLDAAWAHLLPAVDGDVDATADADLATTMSVLALPPLAMPTLVGGDADVVAGGVFAASPSPDDRVRGLDRIELDRAVDGTLALTLVDGDTRIPARAGIGGWCVAGAVAASAAVGSDGVLEAAVRFVETPHLLHVRFDTSMSTFTARWQTEPLHDVPATLHRPTA